MKELIDLQRALHVPKDQTGHKYNYRKADDILKAVKRIAPENVYVILTDEIINVGTFNYMKATATIYNGKESVSASSSAKEGQLPGQSEPQISGSCSTYARKKALEGLFALDDDNDPDKNKPQKESKIATKEQIDLLHKCVKALEDPHPVRSAGLNKLIVDGMFSDEADKLYNSACKVLGRKI